MGKRTNYAALRQGFGLARGLSDEFIQACERINPPIEAIHRLVTPNGRPTMDELVRRAVADWQAEQSSGVVGMSLYDPLPANHYRVRVNRGLLPRMATLEAEFSKSGVSALYNRSYTWIKDRSRVGANDVTADEVVMVAKQFTAEEFRGMGGLTSEKVIAWGSRNGLVAADEKETHAFGINPETRDLQRSRWLVGLGSSTMDDDYREVAVLDGYSGRRLLGTRWFGHGWRSDHWFLFVLRK